MRARIGRDIGAKRKVMEAPLSTSGAAARADRAPHPTLSLGGERGKGAGYLNIEKLISFSVMNSSRTGMPSRVLAIPRLMAGMISPGSVMRSP